MGGVIAVTEQSPEQVFAYLTRCGKAKSVTYVPADGVLNPESKYRPHIFVIGSALYSRNAVAIRALSDKHTIYVFGHRNILSYYGLTVGLMLHELEPERAKLSPVGNYLKTLKKQAVASSLFHHLMTFIYKLPSKTHQKPITNAICKWIHDGDPRTPVELVASLPHKMKASQKHELAKILSSPVAARLRQTFEDLRTGAADTVGRAVDMNRVQRFEYSYIAGNIAKTENITDTYVANRGVE